MTSINFNALGAVRAACSTLLHTVTCGCLQGRKAVPVAPRTVSVDSWPPKQQEATKVTAQVATKVVAQAAAAAAEAAPGAVEIDMQPSFEVAAPDIVVHKSDSQAALGTFRNHFVYKSLLKLLPEAGRRSFEQAIVRFYEAAKQGGDCLVQYKALAAFHDRAIAEAKKNHKSLEVYFRAALLDEFVTTYLPKAEDRAAVQQNKIDYMRALTGNGIAVDFARACAKLAMLHSDTSKMTLFQRLKKMIGGFEEAAKNLAKFSRDDVEAERVARVETAVQAFVKTCADLTGLLDSISPKNEESKEASAPEKAPVPQVGKKKRRSTEQRNMEESFALLARLQRT